MRTGRMLSPLVPSDVTLDVEPHLGQIPQTSAGQGPDLRQREPEPDAGRESDTGRRPPCAKPSHRDRENAREFPNEIPAIQATSDIASFQIGCQTMEVQTLNAATQTEIQLPRSVRCLWQCRVLENESIIHDVENAVENAVENGYIDKNGDIDDQPIIDNAAEEIHEIVDDKASNIVESVNDDPRPTVADKDKIETAVDDTSYLEPEDEIQLKLLGNRMRAIDLDEDVSAILDESADSIVDVKRQKGDASFFDDDLYDSMDADDIRRVLGGCEIDSLEIEMPVTFASRTAAVQQQRRQEINEECRHVAVRAIIDQLQCGSREVAPPADEVAMPKPIDEQADDDDSPGDLVDSDDEEDVPNCSDDMLSGSQLRRREARLAKEARESEEPKIDEAIDEVRTAAWWYWMGMRSEWSAWRGIMSDAMIKVVYMSANDIAAPECNDDDIIGDTEDRTIDAVPRERKTGTKPPMQQSRRIGTRRFKMARGITVDSGAADNVLPRRMIRGRGNRIRPSRASEAGVHYVTASANRIPNEGETDLAFTTSDGKDISWLFQVAEVNKVLASVSYLVDAGHRVVFDRDPKTGADISVIVNKNTGEEVAMRRDNNVWVIDAFIEEDSDELFARPE